MKIKYFLLLAVSLLLAHVASSQELQVLQQQVKTAKTFKEKLHALDALASFYTWTDGGHATARTYGREMISLAKKSEDKELEALAYVLNGNRMVEAVSSTEREKEFRGYFSQAIRIAREKNLPYYEASAYIGLSRIPFHSVWMNADEALRWGDQALSLSTAIANDSLKAMALVAVANGHHLKKNNLAAFRYFTKAVELAESLQDPYLLAYCYRIFGRFYHDLGEADKALNYFSKAIESLKRKEELDHRDLPWLFMTQWNTTWAHMAKGEKEAAVASAYKVKGIATTYNLPSSFQNAPLNQLLTLYIAYDSIQQAQDILTYNPQLYNFYHGHDYEHTFYSQKADLFRKTNQSDSADYYYRQSIATIGKSVPYWSPGKHLEYGYFLLGQRRIPEAIVQLETARSESQKLHLLDALAASYKALDSAYYSAGNIKKAYQHKKLYHRTNDSLQQLSKDKELALLEVQNEQKKLEQAQLEKEALTRYRNRIRTYSLLGGLGVLLIVAGTLYRNNRQKKKANTQLKLQKEKTEQALLELKATQVQLVQKQKMASLGELTAGIAHEIQNPLNFINNFSEVSQELIDELRSEKRKGISDNELEEELLCDIHHNLQKIHQHGRRADAIVKNMLQHARPLAGKKQLVNLNTLLEENLYLAYYGMKTKDEGFACTLDTSFDLKLEEVEVVPQELGRVLLNLFNNAFYAVQQKQRQGLEKYEPKVKVSTHKMDSTVEIKVWDNGTGITDIVRDKIFQPFFTTKPTGQGTGLGLSLSYDIITKGHEGDLVVETEQGEWTEFTVTLPRTPAAGLNVTATSTAALPTADTIL